MTYIQNEPRFKQAGLLKGSERLGVASTDIDALCELGTRGYIFIEYKTYGTELSKSQRVTFTRLLQDLNKPAFLIVASHVTEPDDEIAENAFVDEVYWRVPDFDTSLQYHTFDTTPDEDFLVPRYNGDLIPLNHFVTAIAWTICPRLLNDKAELPARDNTGTLDEILKPWNDNPTQTWMLEVAAKAKELGSIKRAPTAQEEMAAVTG